MSTKEVHGESWVAAVETVRCPSFGQNSSGKLLPKRTISDHPNVPGGSYLRKFSLLCA
jgi:hypothetical protein